MPFFGKKLVYEEFSYTTDTNATICTKPRDLPMFYLTVGCRVVLYVSGMVGIQNKS